MNTIEINESYRQKAIEQHRQIVDEAQGMLTMFRIKFENLNETVTNLQAIKHNKLDFESEKLKIEKRFKNTHYILDSYDIRLNRLQSFVDKQIPYDFTRAIAEAIDYSSTDDTVRYKLKEFMEPKFSDLKSIFSKDSKWFIRNKHLIEMNDSNFTWNPDIKPTIPIIEETDNLGTLFYN